MFINIDTVLSQIDDSTFKNREEYKHISPILYVLQLFKYTTSTDKEEIHKLGNLISKHKYNPSIYNLSGTGVLKVLLAYTIMKINDPELCISIHVGVERYKGIRLPFWYLKSGNYLISLPMNNVILNDTPMINIDNILSIDPFYKSIDGSELPNTIDTIEEVYETEYNTIIKALEPKFKYIEYIDSQYWDYEYKYDVKRTILATKVRTVLEYIFSIYPPKC